MPWAEVLGVLGGMVPCHELLRHTWTLEVWGLGAVSPLTTGTDIPGHHKASSWLGDGESPCFQTHYFHFILPLVLAWGPLPALPSGHPSGA